MKKLITVVLICTAIVSGVYTLLWWFHAKQLKECVTAFIEGHDCHLQHEGITCKGFPLELKIVIKNPHLTHASSTPYIEITTQGSWTLGMPILRSKGWAEVSGKTQINDLACTHQPSSVPLTISGVLRCETHLSKSYNPIPAIRKKLDISIQELLQDISLHTEGVVITYGLDHQAFLEADRAALHWKTLEGTSPHSLVKQFKLDVQGYELHKRGLEDLQIAYNMLKNDMVVISCLDDYGKSDLFLQGHVLGTVTEEEEFSFATHLPIGVEIEKLTSSSPLGQSTMAGKLEMRNIQPDRIECTFSFHSKGQVTHQYHRFYTSFLQSLAQQFQNKGYLALYPQWENLFTHHFDQVSTLIPDYSVWGPTETHIDLSLQAKLNNVDQDIEAFSINLNQYLLKTAQHEIALQGYAGFENVLQPSFLRIQISNHRQLIQDLTNYYHRWRSVLTSTNTVPETQMPFINASVTAQVTNFLESFSQTDQDPTKNLDIIMQGKNAEDFTIGSYNFQQLSSTFDQLCLDISPEIYPPLDQKR